MGELVKIGIKVGIVTLAIAAFAVFVLTLQLPSVDSTILFDYIDSVYTFAVHWCPVIHLLYTLSVYVIGVNISVLVLRIALLIPKTAMAIFE